MSPASALRLAQCMRAAGQLRRAARVLEPFTRAGAQRDMRCLHLHVECLVRREPLGTRRRALLSHVAGLQLQAGSVADCAQLLDEVLAGQAWQHEGREGMLGDGLDVRAHGGLLRSGC